MWGAAVPVGSLEAAPCDGSGLGPSCLPPSSWGAVVLPPLASGSGPEPRPGDPPRTPHGRTRGLNPVPLAPGGDSHSHQTGRSSWGQLITLCKTRVRKAKAHMKSAGRKENVEALGRDS